MIDRLTAADILAATPLKPASPNWTLQALSPTFTSHGWAITTDPQLARHQGHSCPDTHTMTYLFGQHLAAVVDLMYDWDEAGLAAEVEKVTFYDVTGYDSRRVAVTYGQRASAVLIEEGAAW